VKSHRVGSHEAVQGGGGQEQDCVGNKFFGVLSRVIVGQIKGVGLIITKGNILATTKWILTSTNFNIPNKNVYCFAWTFTI
jgi:hypothetical protein